MNLKSKYFLLLLPTILFLAEAALADIEFGAGMNSYVAGRSTPALEASYITQNSAISWYGVGVRNSYYYQSSHQVAYYKTWNVGTFWGGNMNAGFGGALGYSQREFADEGSTTSTKATDYIGGPAFRMNLTYSMIFLNVSAVFGLRNLSTHLVGLSFQDAETVSLGVRF